MVYKIDSADGDVLTWSVTETGVSCEVGRSYTPMILQNDVTAIRTSSAVASYNYHVVRIGDFLSVIKEMSEISTNLSIHHTVVDQTQRDEFRVVWNHLWMMT